MKRTRQASDDISPYQTLLSSDQVAEFYLDCFAADQVAHFEQLVPVSSLDATKTVVDVGGGCGFFAKLVQRKIGAKVRVIDSDATSIEACWRVGVEAVRGDALAPPIVGDEEVVCFNLILHHLVARNERLTRALQKQALASWLDTVKYVFVSEYVYESFAKNASGRLIYQITKNGLLSAVASTVSRLIPSLRANTFGVGVRFRGHDEWITLFEEAGFRLIGRAYGTPEPVAHARRLLLVRALRRDGFLLAPA